MNEIEYEYLILSKELLCKLKSLLKTVDDPDFLNLSDNIKHNDINYEVVLYDKFGRLSKKENIPKIKLVKEE